MDQITVSGLTIWAHHGVLESEQQQGQRFVVDCTFSLETSLCHDDVIQTVNYSELSQVITAFCQSRNFRLIETLANALADHLLLQFPLIEDLTLTIHKPQAPIALPFSDVSIRVSRGWTICYLGIGSNLGDRESYLNLVNKELSNDAHTITLAKSSYYETEAYGVTDQPKFLNGVIKMKTCYTPKQLLAFCQRLESLAGRVKTRHWGERTLDVDILLYGNQHIDSPELCIPHAELHLRRFVLAPLCEISPQLVHPLLCRTTTELLEPLKQGRETLR